MDKIISTCLN